MTDIRHRGAAWPIIPGAIPPFFDHPDRACAGKDTNLWFPETGGQASRKAVAICGGCPILDTCRRWSLDQPPQLCGVWGGLTEDDRRRVRTGKPLKAQPATHQTVVAFQRPIPTGPKSAAAAKVRDLVAIYDGAGHSIEAIAARIGCSYRTVQRHLRALRQTGTVAA